MRRLAALVATVAACGLVACGGGDDADPGTAHSTSGDSGPFRSLAIDIKVTPPEAGSEDEPTGVKLDLGLKLGEAKGVEPPLVEGVDIDFPPGTVYNGDRHAACTKRILEAYGPDGCPPESIMGEGTLLAYADVARSPGRITVVNGGARRLYFWTELDRPARVQAPVVGTIIPNDDDGGYRLALAIPNRLQIVVGIPIALREMNVSVGQGDWIATTDCPDDHWTFKGGAHFGDGSSISRDTEVDCD